MLVILFLLRPKQTPSDQPFAPQLPLSLKSNGPGQTNLAAEVVTKTASITNSSTHSEKSLDATKTDDIAQWTNAIPSLKLQIHSKYLDSWVMAKIGETNPPKVIVSGANGETVQYPADLISIDVIHDQIQRIDLHAPKMNIDDLRQFGNKLLQLMGKNTTDFNAWCDKVGNKWMDQPEYSSGNAQVPNSDKSYGFTTHHTFDNDKPWYIYFVIAGK